MQSSTGVLVYSLIGGLTELGQSIDVGAYIFSRNYFWIQYIKYNNIFQYPKTIFLKITSQNL